MIEDIGIIFLAAGSSSRYGNENKLLEMHNGLPVFLHSIKKLSHLCKDDNIVIVCSKNNINNLKQTLNKSIPNNKFIIVEGGKERFNSVHNGLKKLIGKVKYTAIHDTARPLVTEYIFKKCYDSCKTHGSGVAAKRISDTIKRTDTNTKVIETLDRNNLWAIETPQIFKTEEIFTAYNKILNNNTFITDDAGAMEYIGKNVYLVENPYPNKKITYKSDLKDLN